MSAVASLRDGFAGPVRTEGPVRTQPGAAGRLPRARRARCPAGLGVALLAGGSLAAGCAGPARRSAPPRAEIRGAPIQLALGVAHADIARLEEARPEDASELIAYLDDPDPAIRRRAALGLGRFVFPQGGPEITAALCRALSDPVSGVRETAALALGLRSDPAGAGCLVNFSSDPDPAVRAALARAAGHLDVPESRDVALRALRDPDPRVRIEGAQAPGTWSADGPGAVAVDGALLAVLTSSEPGDSPELTAELVWRTLWALGRRRSEKGRAAFLEYTDSENVLARLFAVRGLARIAPSPDAARTFVRAVEDIDWRVATEAATGLGEQAPDPPVVRALLDAVEHRSHHVRHEALASLGRLGVDSKDVRSHLWRGARDLSASVRAEAVVALARVLPPAEALAAVEENRRDSDPIVRQGAARAAAELGSDLAVPVLLEISRDEDRRVAQAALAGLGEHPTRAARERLHEALAHPDNGIVLAAVNALRASGQGSDVPRLRETLGLVRGDIADEIALAIVENVAVIGSDASRRLAETLAGHPDRYVRERARAVLRDVFETPLQGRATPAAATAPNAPPRPGKDFPAWSENPLVEIRTTRGRMVFELFPAEAPVHVHNFLSLADRDHYAGLTFHRVVPDFVVQGGDYRGDGNGGGSWRGGPLRGEFGPRKFVRGTLGMPRYADPDSGGSQFFVTHRPTPHLDGRYTAFGQLREGGAVLDGIQVGDRILQIRLLEPPRRR